MYRIILIIHEALALAPGYTGVWLYSNWINLPKERIFLVPNFRVFVRLK